MDELEELRKKKLMELQKEQQNNIQKESQEQQIQSQLGQLEIVVKQYLSKEALQRYGNLKAAHQEKAVQLLVLIGQAIEQGHIKEKISDEKLKNLLRQFQPEKKEFKIKRI